MNIGIYGGTFSPVHLGHIQMANESISQLNLDRLIIVPNGNPPHKSGIDAVHRFNMASIAFGNIQKVSVSNCEMTGGVSYSVDTVSEIKQLYPMDKLYFIIGADSLRDILKWRRPLELARMVTFAVFERDGIDIDEVVEIAKTKLGCNIIKIARKVEQISSSYLRLAIGVGLDVSDFIGSGVMDYISNNRLYELNNGLGKIRDYLDDRRLIHSVYTTLCGVELSRKLEIDSNKAFIACLLHDVGKMQLMKYNMNEVVHSVKHAYIGAIIAREDFSVTDNDILNAIKYHSTGRVNMSQLERLVYVADKIDRTRNNDTLAKLCFEDFDKGFLQVLKQSYEYTLNKGCDICSDTYDAIKYYDKEIDK